MPRDTGCAGKARAASEPVLAEEEEAGLLAAVFEEAADAVVITDAGASVRYVNAAFERMTGRGRAEVIGHTPQFLQSDRQDRALYEGLRRSLVAGHPWAGRLKNRRKDGSLYEADVCIHPILGAAARVKGYVGVAHDATRQESLEAQLVQAQKMETVGQIASGVAHDFNNQLTVILGYCDLVRRGAGGDDSLRRSVEQISKAADRAAGLTRHLLVFGRKHHFEPRILDLNRFIEEMAKPLARLIGEDIRLEFRGGEGIGQVAADEVHLEQIILNLAINARDAMAQGGRLLIETSNIEVSPEESAVCSEGTPGPYVVLTVADTGIGMDAETRARAFEPFFTTKPVGRGTGLGLPMVRECVHQHGGHIHLESEPGRGTTFRIYFPQAQRAPPAGEQRSEPRLVLGGTETVLVGEDDAALRALAVRVLRECGYRVLEASDGAGALKASRDHRGPIDLLVADVVLPEMSGPSLADCLQRERPGLRVLFMSGYPDRAMAEHGLRVEDLNLLVKPFGPAVLAKRVHRILAGGPAEGEGVERKEAGHAARSV